MIMLYRQKPEASGLSAMRFAIRCASFRSPHQRPAPLLAEAYWLSEILLLLTSRFQQPARMLSRELSQRHSKRIARDRADQRQLSRRITPARSLGKRNML